MLLAQSAAEGTGLLCTLLLIATVIAFIVGVAQALGVLGARSTPGGRYGALVLAVVFLVIYILVC